MCKDKNIIIIIGIIIICLVSFSFAQTPPSVVKVKKIPVPWQFWEVRPGFVQDIILYSPDCSYPVLVTRWWTTLTQQIPLDSLTWDMTATLTWMPVPGDPIIMNTGDSAILNISITGSEQAVLVRYTVDSMAGTTPVPMSRFVNEAILYQGTIIGSLSNFDAHNDYPEPVDNLELDIKGPITVNDVYGWYHGNPLDPDPRYRGWGTPPTITTLMGPAGPIGIEVTWMDTLNPIPFCQWRHFGLSLNPSLPPMNVTAWWTQTIAGGDGGIDDIDMPDTIEVCHNVPVTVWVKNFGTESLPPCWFVYVEIWQNDQMWDRESVHVDNTIMPGEVVPFTFIKHFTRHCHHSVRAFTAYPNDINPQNDMMTKDVVAAVHDPFEITELSIDPPPDSGFRYYHVCQWLNFDVKVHNNNAHVIDSMLSRTWVYLDIRKPDYTVIRDSALIVNLPPCSTVVLWFWEIHLNMPGLWYIDAYPGPIAGDSHPENNYRDTTIYVISVGSISGTKFYDYNGNGERDPEDIGLPSWTIRLDPGPIFTWTDNNGDYTFDWLSAGTYTVSEILKPNWQQTAPLPIPPGTHTVVLADGEVVTGKDFGNKPYASIQDLKVDVAGGIARPGFQKYFGISYQNTGTVPVNGTVVVLTLPSQVNYVSSSPGGVYNAGPPQTVTWNLGTLAPGFIGWLWVYALVPSTVPLGTALTSSATINPIAGDVNPGDNTDTETQIVRGSYDPNDKIVTPEGEITTTQTLQYLVRFQNVGTDTAFIIVVKDTLDEDLDTTTLAFGATSHACAFARDGRVLIWTFNDINLPDSTTNEPASHGFAEFLIRPLPDVEPGSLIENKAGIYFDFNPPVITNTTINTIGLPGWAQLESMPPLVGVTKWHIKDGGALVAVGSDLYAFRGTKTKEFKKYSTTDKSGWTDMETIPFGYKYPLTDPLKINKKYPGKGAALCYDGDHTIYGTKGNGTWEFWAYDITANTWTAKAFIPSLQKIKGGTSMAFKGGKVYLLAGAQKKDNPNNFFVYDPTQDTVGGTPWTALTGAPLTPPATGKPKPFKDGSALSIIGNAIYAIKGGDKYNFFYAYDIAGDTALGTPWTEMESIPRVHPQLGKKNKVGDGGAMTTDGSILYVIKGKGKQDFWSYTLGAKGVWTPLDTIPRLWKKSVPKTGAALAYANDAVYLLKGNKTPEFWYYTPGGKAMSVNSSPSTYTAVMAEKTVIPLKFSFDAKPNPVTKVSTISYTVPVSGKVTLKLYNATGRLVETLVNEYQNAGSYTLEIGNWKLEIPRGIYFLKYESNTNNSELKLIVQ